MAMKVLTIIVSYNFMPWIDHCLGSLKNSAYPTDVIVIDNASSDATVTTLGQRYPWVKLVANDSNLGFGRANNIGIQYAIKHQYDAVLLLNQDAWIEPDTLDKMVNAAQRHPDYGIVSPLHLTGQGDGLDKGFAHYTGIKDLHLLPGDEIVPVPFINAAIWFISLEVLKRVGLFDPVFYHYGEDIDLTHRMSCYHYKTGYVPSAIGFHDRDDRPVDRHHFFRSEYVYHLAEYTNINYSLAKAFSMSILAVFKKVLTSLMHGRADDAKTYAAQAFRLLCHTSAVCSSRKRSRQVRLSNY